MDRPIRLGLEISPPSAAAHDPSKGGVPAALDQWRATAVALEAAGFDALWLAAPGADGLDPCTLAAGLVPSTRTLVLGVVARVGPDDRLPSVLARDVTALDVVSSGRAAVVLEVGDGPDQAPATPTAMSLRLAEASAVCHALFGGGPATIDGDHFRTARAVNLPLPVRPGGPPLFVTVPTGGARAMATTGALEDWWVVDGGPDDVAEGVAERRAGGSVGGVCWRGQFELGATEPGRSARDALEAGADAVVVRLATDGFVPDPAAVAAAGALLGPLVGPPGR